jgi:hypothetical protein
MIDDAHDDLAMPAVSKTCKNCSEWEVKTWQTDKKNGRCNLSKEGHPMMRSGCGLLTRYDFGCILFKQKYGNKSNG